MSSSSSYMTRIPMTRRDPFPIRWTPPAAFIPRLIFRTLCICATGRWSLDSTWAALGGPNEWSNYHLQYFAQINQFTTGQGLVLTTVAVFISTKPPLDQFNYVANGPFELLLGSLAFSLLGLLLQLCTSVVGPKYPQRKTYDALKQSRWWFLCYLITLTFPIYAFAISLLLLIFAISITVFLSSLKSAQIVTGTTFVMFAVYLPAFLFPLFSVRLYRLLWGTDEDEMDSEAGSAA